MRTLTSAQHQWLHSRSYMIYFMYMCQIKLTCDNHIFFLKATMEKYICELRNAFWCVQSNRSLATTNHCAQSWPTHRLNHRYSLNKTDTIVDFLQMIFKIIIQNSNTASQSNKLRQIQKTFESSSKRKVREGQDFPKTKRPDTDVILSPSFPLTLYKGCGVTVKQATHFAFTIL